MATPTHRPTLEPDLAAALRGPDPGPAATPARAWQATLFEETPCSSTCT
jgi:hypothetical protein